MAVSDADIRLAREIDPDRIATGLAFEQDVWLANGYGSLDEYREFDNQSRVFIAERNGECVGIVRIFLCFPKLAPFLGLPISDASLKKQLLRDSETGRVEELGTAAVSPDVRAHGVALGLWRLAYRDAVARGCETWGIIMEPERVSVMNRRYGFCFEQLGPAVDYQGGLCAAHAMSLERVRIEMAESHPQNHEWFVEAPLDGLRERN